jgi:hypothetical protein
LHTVDNGIDVEEVLVVGANRLQRVVDDLPFLLATIVERNLLGIGYSISAGKK